MLVLQAAACQTRPYAPPPQAAQVESLEVVVGHFAGRPEAQAIVRGRLSSSAAQLVESRQSRDGRSLVLEVLEQTPRGAQPLPDLAESPPFETRVPIEILGLEPGPVVLHANGHSAEFEIPHLHAEPTVAEVPQARSRAITLVDEFVAPAEERSSGGNLRRLRFGGSSQTASQPVSQPASTDAMTDL